MYQHSELKEEVFVEMGMSFESKLYKSYNIVPLEMFLTLYFNTVVSFTEESLTLSQQSPQILLATDESYNLG